MRREGLTLDDALQPLSIDLENGEDEETDATTESSQPVELDE